MWLLLTLPVSAGQLPPESDAVSWRKTRKIIDFMRIYGPPDTANGQKMVQTYHWKRVVTLGFSGAEGGETKESFTCEVIAKVAAGGSILQVKADVANPGALAIASIGGFGPSCEKAFGLKSTTRSVSSKRMRR
ncbi:hypothetical protein [Bradyrhizobium sp. MOS003]|uniref:hypothetical protein n=1 Tax=Bradyrhizobium sp. MOS003 TaxID=2133946 RepID=UPI0011BF4AFF|nr:hypothetical protein [Bradyrhizobium sp. MOS003]